MIRSLLRILLFTVFLAGHACAQSPLDHLTTFRFDHDRLENVLEMIGRLMDRSFSYNSNLFDKDSLVTLTQQNVTVRRLLDTLFHGRLDYREDGRYIILLPAAPKPKPAEPKRVTINGIILDKQTGEKLHDASIYDTSLLLATLSRTDGSFTIRLRSRDRPSLLTISKEFYLDTTIRLTPGESQSLTILLAPAFTPKATLLSSPQSLSADSITIAWQADSARITAIVRKDLVQVEMTGFGRFLLSSRLRMQTLNLKRLFIQRPVQVSLLPGLSTNGSLNSQVTNKFSVNIIGGYSTGTTGAELAGVFSIDKRKMQGFQAAGVFNLAGDSVQGVQMAGMYNRALDTMKGMQASGVANVARYVKGVQLAGAVNYTHHLRGLQLGVVNIADTSEGVSIGLVNIVKHGGIHELSLFTDEFAPLNLAFRSGNKALYSILLAGWNPGTLRRSYYAGFGLGHRFPINSALSLELEGSSSHVAPLAWKNFGDDTWIHRLNLLMRWQATRGFSVSAGPSVAFYTPQHDYAIQGHLYSPVNYSTFTISGNNVWWIGWHAAVNFF